MSVPDATPLPLAAFSDGLADAVEHAGRSVVAINGRPRIPSSGVLWRPGVVVATSHTVRRDDDLTVLLGDGRTVPATLAGRDPGTDLCVLRVDGGSTPAATIGDAARLRVGQMVLAVGRPGEHGPTAALGVVSAVGGPWRTWGGGQLDRFVRLDLAIYDGFSGGPLVSAAGEVLGVNSSALARGAPVTIPADTVERVVEQLLSGGRVRRGYLGLALQPVRLPRTLVERLGLPGEAGLMAVGVEADGPAERSGMLIGDVLVALDGTPVRDTDDVVGVLHGREVGSGIPAQVIRGGVATTLTLLVGERAAREG